MTNYRPVIPDEQTVRTLRFLQNVRFIADQGTWVDRHGMRMDVTFIHDRHGVDLKLRLFSIALPGLVPFCIWTGWGLRLTSGRPIPFELSPDGMTIVIPSAHHLITDYPDPVWLEFYTRQAVTVLTVAGKTYLLCALLDDCEHDEPKAMVGVTYEVGVDRATIRIPHPRPSAEAVDTIAAIRSELDKSCRIVTEEEILV